MSGRRFSVRLKRRALKSLERLPRLYLPRIIEVLDALEEDPLPYKKYDLRKLRGYEDTYRIRIGDIRLIYSIDWDSNSIIIHFVGLRESAYK